MMNGIDISKWQKGLDLSKIKCDFVIVNASEGAKYVDPCFYNFIEQAKLLGKCIGFYHYARPDKNDPKSEAKNFYDTAIEYFHDGIPILDWESVGKEKVAWAKEWLDEIQRLTGVKPMIYMSESVVNSNNWSDVANADYGLWVARYRDHNPDYNHDMSNAGKKPVVKWWKFYAMWQWTSTGRLDGYNGNIDCDVFYGDKKAWNAYAGKAEKKTYTVKQGDTLETIAKNHNTTIEALVAKNNLISVGQVLDV